MTFHCRTCDEHKPREDFHTTSRGRRYYLCKECHRLYVAARRVGLTVAEYRSMLVRAEWLCESCGQPESRISHQGGPKNLSIDHCHTTGEVRGVLCTDCNIAIGHAFDDPDRLRKMADYLERHRSLAQAVAR